MNACASWFFLIAAVSVGPSIGKAETLYAFATNSVGTGYLHGWPEAASSNHYGLAAADAVCQAQAMDAHLPKPASFVAWLSDRDNDAYCRLFGLGGKKADNCGQSALPTAAGPWLRTDGVPFASTIEEALDHNVVYSTLNVDASGESFHTYAISWTATDNDGTFNTEMEQDADCEQWTSESGDPFAPFPTVGSNLASSEMWTYNGTGVSCNGHRRLTCLQLGSGPPLQSYGSQGHRQAFVTSDTQGGDLGGFIGADQICQSAASTANLHQPDTFKAMLSSSTYDIGITDRITFDGPWYRIDGLLFAHNKSELVSGRITLPINQTELGTYLGIAVGLTGSDKFGVPISGWDCAGWTGGPGSTETTGALLNTIAFADTGGTNWLNVSVAPCVTPPPPETSYSPKLICLSDSDVLFYAGFDVVPPL